MSIDKWLENKLSCYHTEIIFSNKIEWTTNICHSIDESQSNYAEWEGSTKKSIRVAWFNLYKVLEIQIIL